MSGRSAICDLAVRLHARDAVWRALALLTAYFDESGTHAASTTTAIAGFVATDDTWRSVEQKWVEEISLFNDKGVTSFHMTDCISGEGQFARVEYVQRNALIKRLSWIMRDADIYAIVVTVDNNDWTEVVADKVFLDEFPKPYDLCFHHVVGYLQKWAKRHAGGEHVAPVFAYQPEYSPRTTAVYGSKSWYRDVLAAIAFDYPDRIPALQTADFLANQVAYEAHHLAYDKLTLENLGLTLAYANATAKHGLGGVLGYDKVALQAAIRRFRETGSIFLAP